MDKKYIDGLFIKSPREGAPDFVIARGSINKEKILAFLAEHDGEWVNFDILRGKDGDVYSKIDTWKPNQEQETTDAPDQNEPNPDDIPF